ncbi:MAG: PAS domain-containing protein [Sulfuritalea sp.]|nr:PAS domain-containing protein [Sulfuritalea sp.]
MDALPAAAFIKDEASTTLCNRYMAELIGAPGWLGKNAGDLFPRELAEKMSADDRRALAAGRVVVEEQVPTADGRMLTFETTKFAIPRPGKPRLCGGIALDITEHKLVEAQVRATGLL